MMEGDRAVLVDPRRRPRDEAGFTELHWEEPSPWGGFAELFRAWADNDRALRQATMSVRELQAEARYLTEYVDSLCERVDNAEQRLLAVATVHDAHVHSAAAVIEARDYVGRFEQGYRERLNADLKAEGAF